MKMIGAAWIAMVLGIAVNCSQAEDIQAELVLSKFLSEYWRSYLPLSDTPFAQSSSNTIAARLGSDSSFRQRLGIASESWRHLEPELFELQKQEAAQEKTNRLADEPDPLGDWLRDNVPNSRRLGARYLQLEGLAALSRPIFVSLNCIDETKRALIESDVAKFRRRNLQLARANFVESEPSKLREDAVTVVMARDFRILRRLSQDELKTVVIVLLEIE